jgi:NTE family protein
MSNSQARTVSLVLGSGGARGLAHIGVIDALDAAGFDIRAIAGCSMGALVGGVYAMGKLDLYRDWVCALERLDVLRLLDFSFQSTGLIKGDRIIEVLRKELGDTRIEDLPIRFTAVATDLDAQKEIWLEEGPLFDAVRASMAIPTVFTPAKWRGRRLVDGGLLNPIPIAPTLRYPNDLTIAVNLGGRPDPKLRQAEAEPVGPRADEETAGRYHEAIAKFVDEVTARLAQKMPWSDSPPELRLFDVVNRSFDVMQTTLARLKIAAYAPNLIIDIPRNVCLTYEYYRAEEIIHVGRAKTEAALATLAEQTGPSAD